MKIVIHPRALKCPACLGDKGCFNLLMKKPNLDSVQFVDAESTGIPIENSEPSGILMFLVAMYYAVL